MTNLVDTLTASAGRPADWEPKAPSVFAELRERHPELQTQRLRKSTLLALSWAIEDEMVARADNPVLIGSFQHGSYFFASRRRWRELARVSRAAVVMAQFDGKAPEVEGVLTVDFAGDEPMRREWNVICDAHEYSAMLTAWELPGQGEVLDRDRLFESIYTIEPHVTRDATRACLHVAAAHGLVEAHPLLFELADEPPASATDAAAASAVFNRTLAYVDAFG